MKSKPVVMKRWDVTPYSDWTDMFHGKCNWYNFTFIRFDVEYAKYMGQIELTLGLLGWNLCITYTYDFTFVESLSSEADRIKAALQAENPDKDILDPNDILKDLVDEEDLPK